LGAAHAGRVGGDHVPPGGAPGDVRVGDRGGDLAEGVVVLLGQSRVGGQDHARAGVGHALEVDPVGLVEEHRRLGAQLLELRLDPGEHAVVVVVAEVRRRHPGGDHAERERDLVVRPGDGGDHVDRRRDLGGAEGVVDARRVAGAGCAGVAAVPSGGAGIRGGALGGAGGQGGGEGEGGAGEDRKSTRLNSSHVSLSYAVCCGGRRPVLPFPTRRSSDLGGDHVDRRRDLGGAEGVVDARRVAGAGCAGVAAVPSGGAGIRGGALGGAGVQGGGEGEGGAG